MQQKQQLVKWTKISSFLLLAGALAWTVKLAIIIATNGRIINTGAAAFLMTAGLLLLPLGATGIGHRLTVNQPLWLRVLAIVLSPVACAACLFVLSMNLAPLFENSSIWYAKEEAPIGVAVLLFSFIGLLLFRNRYAVRKTIDAADPGVIKKRARTRLVLKWTGFALLILVAGLAVATASRQHLTYEAPYPLIKASTDSTVIAKGKQLTLVQKGCVHCHSPVNNIDSMLKSGGQPSLAGAKRFETPFGTFYTPNLTPETTTGIGSLTDAEIARVLRYSVKKNGEAVLPFMQGTDMNDDEMTAVISYLRSLKPIVNKVPENEFNLVGRFAKAFVIKPATPEHREPLAKN